MFVLRCLCIRIRVWAASQDRLNVRRTLIGYSSATQKLLYEPLPLYVRCFVVDLSKILCVYFVVCLVSACQLYYAFELACNTHGIEHLACRSDVQEVVRNSH